MTKHEARVLEAVRTVAARHGLEHLDDAALEQAILASPELIREVERTMRRYEAGWPRTSRAVGGAT